MPKRVHARYAAQPMIRPWCCSPPAPRDAEGRGALACQSRSNAHQIFQHGRGFLTTATCSSIRCRCSTPFGLTAWLLTPLLNGMKCVLYPSPLHYKQVPKLVAETKATVLLATDTFLQGYARAGRRRSASVRFVVAGQSG